MTDAETKEIRDILYQMAEITTDSFLELKKKDKNK